MARLSALGAGRLYPIKYSWYSFLLLIYSYSAKTIAERKKKKKKKKKKERKKSLSFFNSP